MFSNYVSDLFNLRFHYKNIDLNISQLFKLMLNSLSGRFGVHIKKSETNIFDAESEILFAETYDIVYKNTLKLTDDLVLLNYNSKKLIYDLELKKLNSRIDWAAAITAEARILIQKLKDIVDVYYVDTDALVIKASDLNKLNNYIQIINNYSLGKLKVIYLCSFCVFVAPKTYILGIKTSNNFYKINNILSDKTVVFNLVNKFLNELNAVPFTNDYFIDLYFNDAQLNTIYDKRLKIYKDNV